MRRGTVTVSDPHERIALPTPQICQRATAVLSALVVVGTLLFAPASAGAAERTPIVVGIPPETTFFGRGWGHGVGMSQHGAPGRALAGQSASEILAH